MARPRPLTRKSLVGGWKLEDWRTVYDDGRVSRPLGKRPQGVLLYTDDGGMSASIMSARRKALSSANPREARATERAQAFDSYVGYAGRWRLVRGRIEHRVTVALNPALIGTRQWREASLIGDRLYLVAEERRAGAGRRHEVVWRRARSRASA